MNKAYLLIGGNMGDRLANLEMAKLAIHQEIGPILLSSSTRFFKSSFID